MSLFPLICGFLSVKTSLLIFLYNMQCCVSKQETTFIEQVVADERDMEGVPPACSRILNWHLHLDALDVPYPQGWVVQKNLEALITVK